MSDSAVAEAPEQTEKHKDAIALADTLHALIGKAQFDQATENAHHNNIRAYFKDVLDTLDDDAKSLRMASVDLSTPGAPTTLMHGFTQEQFDAAVAKQVQASIASALKEALQANNAERDAAIASAVQAALAQAQAKQAATAATPQQAGT